MWNKNSIVSINVCTSLVISDGLKIPLGAKSIANDIIYYISQNPLYLLGNNYWYHTHIHHEKSDTNWPRV